MLSRRIVLRMLVLLAGLLALVAAPLWGLIRVQRQVQIAVSICPFIRRL
jgi:hypothetical protein